jgi:AcrR family transcriptional regulator
VVTRTARTPRLAPEERRRQLLDAALEVLVTEGLDALSVEAVARRAGVTRPVVYDQFGDLDRLLLALVDREQEAALRPLLAIVGDDPGEVDPDAFLVDGVRSFLRAVREEPRTWRLVLMPPDGGSPEVRARIERSRQAITDRVAGLLAWGIERRGGPIGISAALYARLLVAAGEDAARLVLSDPDRFSPERLAEMAGALVGLVPRSGRIASPAVTLQRPASPSRDAAAAARRPPGRLPRAARREQLLDEALALVAEEGFDGLSIEAIARRSGVSRVVVYRSFINLGALLLALLRREEARVQPGLELLAPAELGGRSPPEALVDGLEGFLAMVAAAPLTWRLALQRPESAPKPLRRAVARRRADLAARLRPLVESVLGALDAPVAGLDVDLLARLLLTLGEEHGRIALDHPDVPADRLVRNARAFLDLLPWR